MDAWKMGGEVGFVCDLEKLFLGVITVYEGDLKIRSGAKKLG